VAASSYDIWLIGLAAAVIVLFAAYFWHVARTMIGTARSFSNYLDTRAERQRAAYDHERRHGKPPLWLRSVRFLLITLMACGMAALLWNKIRVA
jgi:hypothetical protein